MGLVDGLQNRLAQALLPRKPKGLVAAYEMLVVTPAISNLIRENKTYRIDSSIQTGRKLLGRILAAPLPWRVKLEAFVHLTNNVSYLLMVVLGLLVFPAILIRRGTPVGQLLLIDLPLFLAATVSVSVEASGVSEVEPDLIPS